MRNPVSQVATALATSPRDFRFVYSLRDIHHLMSLTHEERARVVADWRAWHRRNASLSRVARVIWGLAAIGAWLVLFRSAEVSTWLATTVAVTPSPTLLIVAGALAAVGLLVTLPAVLSAAAASALCDAYMAGYSDGMTAGVTRALQITPEREAELWDELHEAKEKAI